MGILGRKEGTMGEENQTYWKWYRGWMKNVGGQGAAGIIAILVSIATALFWFMFYIGVVMENIDMGEPAKWKFVIPVVVGGAVLSFISVWPVWKLMVSGRDASEQRE
jgi:hypothetical protein